MVNEAQDRQSPRDPVAFSVGARIVVGLAGVLLLGLLVVLFAVLGTLKDTRAALSTTKTIVNRTDSRIERLAGGLDPLLTTTQPLGDPATRRSVRHAARTASTAVGLIPGVAGSAGDAAAAARGIAAEVQGAGLGPSLAKLRLLADVGTPALQDLAPRLTRLLASLDTGPAAPGECDRRLRSAAPSQPGQLACALRLLPSLRAQLRTVRSKLARSLAVQRSTETLTATTVGLFRQSLAIQQELLVRVRSLDTRFGGPAPAH